MDFVTARSCRLCDRLHTPIVSVFVFYLHFLCFESLICSVTLYAEFLPTKQRAKCVVLLDVRACYFRFFFVYVQECFFSVFGLLVLVWKWL